jgi:hypothetical protein
MPSQSQVIIFIEVYQVGNDIFSMLNTIKFKNVSKVKFGPRGWWFES